MNALPATPVATLDAVALDAWVDETAHALDLEIDPAFRPAVLDNLAVLQVHAARMAEALARAETEGAARAAQV